MSAHPIATIIIYILLLNPILYCLWRHRRYGILAFLHLSSFCILQIVASILQLHAEASHSSMTNALLLNNIGLSPLLLGALGLLHEARTARNPPLRKKLEWFLVINFHGLVVGALALVIAGVTGEEGKDPKPVDLSLRKAGLLIVVACWFVLVAWVAVSFLRAQFDVKAPAYTDGSRLLYAVALALPFVGCRELYAVLSTFLTSPTFADDSNPPPLTPVPRKPTPYQSTKRKSTSSGSSTLATERRTQTPTMENQSKKFRDCCIHLLPLPIN